LSDLLLRGVTHVATFDDDDTELTDADILIENGVIAAVGRDLSADDAQVVDGTGFVVLPGLVNAHQHLYQGALRAIPELERALIGPWLAGVSGRCLEWWRAGRFGPDEVRAVAAAVLAESLLGGVTTVADQHYFFPSPEPPPPTGRASLPFVEATIDAATAVGVRLHACRGSITLGRAAGGTASEATVQDVDEVVRHCAELIDRFHDPAPGASVRIALAPCGVHVDRPELFEELAALASAHEAVGLHTHLYEKVDDDFCRARYGISPWRFLEEHGWARPGTWLAHVVDPPPDEIPEMAAAGVGVAHLIGPDLRMGWGAAPVRAYLDAGVTLGFGTTGSASNDSADVLGDLRLAALAHRRDDVEPEQWPSARELLRAATRGSADCLGRPDLGRIAPGATADLAAWDLRTVDRVGVHDPLTGLLLTGLSSAASLVVVGGRVVVEDGAPVAFDPADVARTARRALGVTW
jgi:cytosine/adenosine deaminase-related metal-dependent hydrolase